MKVLVFIVALLTVLVLGYSVSYVYTSYNIARIAVEKTVGTKIEPLIPDVYFVVALVMTVFATSVTASLVIHLAKSIRRGV